MEIFRIKKYNCNMRFSKGVSFTFVLAAGFLCSLVLFTAFMLVTHIKNCYSPTLANAERYLKKGKLDDALALVNKIESENAANLVLKGRIWLAMSYQKQKNESWKGYGIDANDWFKGVETQNAEKCFKAAQKEKASDSDPYYYLGVLYSDKGWFFEAESEFKKALQRAPSSVDIRVSMSSLLVKMGKYDEAEGLLRAAYEKAPQNPYVAKNLAFLFRYYKDQADSAVCWFSRYLDNAPPKDIDVTLAKKEYRDIVERYPEFTPQKAPEWSEKNTRFLFR